MNKRLFLEVIVIVLIASAIGLVYNAFVYEPVPLIYKEKPKIAVDDSLLFAPLDTPLTSEVEEITNNELPKGKDSSLVTEEDSCEKVEVIEEDHTEIKIDKTQENSEKYASTEISVSQKKGKLFGHLKEFNNWVSLEQVKKAVGRPDIQFIDAREPESYEEGKIGNALLIFPEYEDENEYFETILSLDPNKTYIIYCTSYDCDLAEMLARDILSFGHIKKVFIYPAGWDEWVKHADT
jgi:rhodanese-related sulfurtransferase